MYGKTLNDFPERFGEFLDEFKSIPPGVLDEAFRLARGVCTEFPTPADVRKQIAFVQVPDEKTEAAYERLKARLAGQGEVKMLSSVTDEQARPLREVRQLSEAEVEQRLEQLAKQKVTVLGSPVEIKPS